MDPVPPTPIPEDSTTPPTPPGSTSAQLATQARILQQVIDAAVNRAMSTAMAGVSVTVDASVRTALSASSSEVPPSSHAHSTGQHINRPFSRSLRGVRVNVKFAGCRA